MASAVSAMRSEQRHAEAAAAVPTLLEADVPGDETKEGSLGQKSTPTRNNATRIEGQVQNGAQETKAAGAEASKTCSLQ